MPISWASTAIFYKNLELTVEDGLHLTNEPINTAVHLMVE